MIGFTSFSCARPWSSASVEELLEKVKALEQQGRVRSFKASQDQILGEGCYADPDSQAICNEHILSLCHTEALNAWDKIQELRERLCNAFSDFLQRLTKAVQRGVGDPEAR